VSLLLSLDTAIRTDYRIVSDNCTWSDRSVIADDFDNDRLLDMVVSNWNSNGQLRFFHNKGDGTFEDRTEAAGLLGFFAGLNLVQADYDNDGDLDVLVLRGGWGPSTPVADHIPNSLLQNDGQGHFTEVLYQSGLGHYHYATQTATWLDYDLDGDLDALLPVLMVFGVFLGSVAQLVRIGLKEEITCALN